MSRKFITGLCAALAVLAFGTMTVGQASGANLVVIQPKEGLLAIYGFPGEQTEASRPIGGGLARNFGFGQNMLFQAGGGKGVPLAFETPTNKVVVEACDSFIGGTLQSNNTGAKNPLGFAIQFADFQCNRAGGVLTASYADTYDQNWITTICPKEAECKPDGILAAQAVALVKIEHIAIDIGPGIVVQGVAWGQWRNGVAGKQPAIVLTSPPAAAVEKEPDQTLIVTQSNNPAVTVGEKITNVKGEADLISANNDWYEQSEKTEPEITIKNE